MVYHTPALLIVAILFVGIILSYLLGIRILNYRIQKNPSLTVDGLGALEGALLGLLSLMLAFTFNKSASNYDTRRKILVHEANNIGTVLLRSDLYPDTIRKEFRTDVKQYLKTRIEYYQAGNDETKIAASITAANSVAEKIWNRAAAISRQGGETVRSMQMIPAVNAMIDSISEREEARIARVPAVILYALFILCLTGSFIIGYAGKSKKTDWVIITSYTVMTVLIVFLILDLDRPHRGIIHTKTVHLNIEQLYNSIQDVGE